MAIAINVRFANRNIKEQISKIYVNELTEDEVDDLILDIGEELRHILYHIDDTKVYNKNRHTIKVMLKMD